ncbi:MAG: glycosyltransferase family 4 protein [Synechococcales bacterium]|nr:glycosyltransferase family 4 protein [Synechococcales bacterium]
MKAQNIAIVIPKVTTTATGGAERFFIGLEQALNAQPGITAELVQVLVDESSFEAIQESYLRVYDLDLSGYDGVISTKAPTYLVRHPNHICYLVHTIRIFYDMFDRECAGTGATLKQQRDLILQLDTGALRSPRTRKVYTIGHEVSRRLMQFNGIPSDVLHPGLVLDDLTAFQEGPYENYLLMPGRLHRWKRVDLAIAAMQQVREPLKLKIVGTGEAEQALRQLAAGDERIEFLGRVDDQTLLDLYRHALGVVFLPIREDYGYITLEAFGHSKPVITCEDSGEPLHFIQHRGNGLVVAPKPQALAAAFTELSQNVAQAAVWGRQGKQSIAHITWSNIAQTLLKALDRPVIAEV